jgi:threonine 3-dehydrogenase
MKNSMRGLAKLKPEPGLWMVENQPIPDIGPDEVLIKIRKTAICGTDMHIWKWDEWAQKTVPVPMITGHEYVGVIEDIGRNVTRFKRGERVSGEGHIVCGLCKGCRGGRRHMCRNTKGVGYDITGAFAEYFALPQDNVIRLPENIPDDIAAILDPLGNAVHTVLEFPMHGRDVLITGAGPIGIMAAIICRHIGARHVVLTDINDFRLDLARKCCSTVRTVNTTREKLPDVMEEIGMREGFEVGLEMSGSAQGFYDMLDVILMGGHIAFLGIPPRPLETDWNRIVFKGLTIKGIYGRKMYDTWYDMIGMLQSGLDVSSVITHHFPVDDFRQGFEAMLSGRSGKVILDWP